MSDVGPGVMPAAASAAPGKTTRMAAVAGRTGGRKSKRKHRRGRR